MPNIEIRGYSPEQAAILKKRIDKVMGKMGLVEEAITSIIPLEAQACYPDAYGSEIRSVPYLRVLSTNLQEIKEILVNFQRNGIHEDTEWKELDGYLSKEQMRAGELASLSS